MYGLQRGASDKSYFAGVTDVLVAIGVQRDRLSPDVQAILFDLLRQAAKVKADV